MINRTSIKTKIGWITVFEKKGRIFKIKFGKINKKFESNTLKKFKNNLLNFFNGKNANIKARLEIKGNRIQKKVWKELQKIAPGKTKSYGEIAKKFKLSPRHVGKICSQNKLLLAIPWHRVIRTDGSLGGFTSSGGISLKKKLLLYEKKL